MTTKLRSVNDFDSKDGLLRALKDIKVTCAYETTEEGDYPSTTFDDILSSTKQSNETSQPDQSSSMDWILMNYDQENSVVQSLDEEFDRLLALKSYLILDSAREATYERLTGLAATFFDVPIALLSFVDLGRNWLMSNRGLGDAREFPRQMSFCAHTILSKDDLMIVPDATKDPRFKDSAGVTGPPFVRFYAGAPLICPEGHKLGTLCIVDTKARPEGFDLKQKQMLRELTALAMDALVERRKEKRSMRQDNSKIIATTAHDLMTPLSGIQTSLSILLDDKKFKDTLNKENEELLATITSCADVMSQYCNDTITSFRERKMKKCEDKEGLKEIQVSEFVKKLHLLLDTFPKSVPLYISVDRLVPDEIFVLNDLNLLRASLNYLTNALENTVQGSVHFKIYVGTNMEKPNIIFQCEDTGPGIPVEKYVNLFRPDVSESPNVNCIQIDKVKVSTTSGCYSGMSHSGLGLYSVANQISALGGEYGYRPRCSKNMETDTGSIFWFSIPLILLPNTQIGEVRKKDLDRHQPYGNDNFVFSGTNNALDDNILCGSKEEFIHTLAGEKTTLCNGSTKSAVDSIFFRDDINVAPTKGKEDNENVVVVVNGKKDLPCDNPTLQNKMRLKCSLVIDDSIVIRKSIGKALSRLGYQVDYANNGLEGLKCLQQVVYDLTLCDFLMPVMDGVDCVKQYREWETIHRPWIRQYIIGISAHAATNDVDKGLQAGMNDFIAKPVTLKHLKKELEANVHLAEISEKLDRRESDAAAHVSWDMNPKAGESTEFPSKSDESLTFNDSSSSQNIRICLIASCECNTVLIDAVQQFGWQAIHVQDGEDFLRLLKTQNWDAIFLENELSRLNGIGCLARFRKWESKNRITRQGNVILLSTDFVPSPEQTELASFPDGFDGAIGSPILLNAVKFYLDRAQSDQTEEVNSRNIIAH